MSFKRLTNSSESALLKKRRVNELFAEDIPADEGKRLSNGRYCCLVCSNKPIFDTVIMLTKHRFGKKHAHFEQIRKERADAYTREVVKRQHTIYCKTGEIRQISASKTTKEQTKSLLQTKPYDPRAMKSRYNEQPTSSKTTPHSCHAAIVSPATKTTINFETNASYSHLSTSNASHLENGNSVVATENVRTKQEALQKYVDACSSGWKRDWDGRWYKDENVEFDSDEEPPTE